MCRPAPDSRPVERVSESNSRVGEANPDEEPTMNEVRKLLESRFPGLHARIEQTLVEAEGSYNLQSKQAPSEFLQEHTQRTPAIAHKLASMEGVDTLLPVLV